MKVGDQITIGQAAFTIRGTLASEPGRRIGGFSLGPRVLVDYDDLPSTGLLSFGSRADRRLHVMAPENQLETLVTSLRRELRDEFINTRSYRSTEDQIGRDFERAENYLSLVGLIIVILGGIAVSSVTRVFILQKMRSIAVLKCVGARSRQIIAVYVLQVMTLGLAGSLLGVAIARRRDRGDPARARRLDIGARRGALRGDGQRGGAGHRDRRPGVAAVLDRAAAGRPLHQAIAAAARREHAAPARLGRLRRPGRGVGGAGRR